MDREMDSEEHAEEWRRKGRGRGVLDESETCTGEYEALWTIEAEVQFTGLPRSVYFVSVLMEWLRFRTRRGRRSSAPFSRR